MKDTINDKVMFKMRIWLVLTIAMLGLLALGLTLGSLPFLAN